MQILIQFYTVTVIFCLLLLSSPRGILQNRFLAFFVLLLIYSIIVDIAAEITRDNLPAVFVISGFVAKTLFIPAAYLHFRDHFYQTQLVRNDLVHALPCLIFCGGSISALLINGNVDFVLDSLMKGQSISDALASIWFQLFFCLVTATYLWILLKMLKSNHMQFRNRHITDSEINPVFSEDGHLEKRNGNHPLFFSDEKMSHIDSAVRQFLTEKKPFLKHGYSLRHLSEDIQLPLHHLSAFINRYYHMNFNDFINEYRVHYCKIKIVNDEWKVKKLEAIAEESGFNNRNTFTSAFKKVTGLNPSEYLKGIKEGQKVIEPIFHTTTEHVARA